MPAKHLVPFVVRDGLLVAANLGLWAWVARVGHAAGAGPVALNILAGLMTVLTGYLVHEWGHLAGCWARGSAVRLPDSVASVFLFNFDVGRNDRRQFNAMAAGGFIASIAFVALLVLLVPRDFLAGKIALVLTVIGVIATLVLEVPTAWRVFRGGALPQQGPAFVSSAPAGKAA